VSPYIKRAIKLLKSKDKKNDDKKDKKDDDEDNDEVVYSKKGKSLNYLEEEDIKMVFTI